MPEAVDSNSTDPFKVGTLLIDASYTESKIADQLEVLRLAITAHRSLVKGLLRSCDMLLKGIEIADESRDDLGATINDLMSEQGKSNRVMEAISQAKRQLGESE